MALENKYTTKKVYTEFPDLKYVPVDFEEIMDLLVQRIKERLPNKWTDFLGSNFGVEIIESVAYLAMLLGYNLDRHVNECFLPTAKTKKSVYDLASLISYKPNPPSNSKVDVTFFIDTEWPNDIIIPKYTKMSSSTGIYFHTLENAVLYKGQTSIIIPCRAGVIVHDTIVSTEKPYYKYELQQYPVCAIDSVFVNDVSYSYLEFLDSTVDTKVYGVNYTNDFKASIYFGDGVYGESPKRGSLIDVYYNIGGGSSSNVKAGTITTILDIIRDTTGYAVPTIKCYNSSKASGGDDEETLDEVKRNAPAIFRTQHRAVTKSDYKDIVLATPGVEKAVVLDYKDDKSIGIYGVKVAVIPKDGGIPGIGFKNSIAAKLEDLKTVSSVVNVIDPTIVPIDLSIVVRINQQYTSSVVLNKLRGRLAEYLSWKNRDFGEDVTAEDIYTIVQNTEGITYSDNLKISPSKTIYLLETPTENTKNIKVIDTLGCLATGVNITLLDENKEFHSSNVISGKDGSEIMLTLPLTNVGSLKKGCRIYPFLTLGKKGNMSDKDIELSSITELLDLSNCVIAFEDKLQDEYTILYRNNNILRLDNELRRDIPANTKIYIKAKDSNPRLDGVHVAGASTLILKNTPRFTIASSVYPMKKISYDIITKFVKKNNTNIDEIDLKEYSVYKIRKVYLDTKYPFVENEDYRIEKNQILWMKENLIPTDQVFYVDVLIQIVEEGKPDNKYYVQYVGDRLIKITPNLLIDLQDEESLVVEADSLNIFGYEIADSGNIEIIQVE